ncbi:hypothetical protein TWF132_012090 [Orbilia oligospora]|nr:hypothetical protein TWF132_012090 [Orbilia oligospora]
MATALTAWWRDKKERGEGKEGSSEGNKWSRNKTRLCVFFTLRFPRCCRRKKKGNAG